MSIAKLSLLFLLSVWGFGWWSLPTPYPLPQEEKEKQRILIIGSAGYIGSYLFQQLQSHGMQVEGIDREPPARDSQTQRRAASSLSIEEVRSYDSIVYLGGLSGRQACEPLEFRKVLDENVDDVATLAGKMDDGQHLIFASTSAIAEGRVDFKEDGVPRMDLYDKYTASMLKREDMLATMENGPTMTGLRFGTVIGVSPASQKLEYVHLAMVCSAFVSGRVIANGPDLQRSFLALGDLADAVMLLLTLDGVDRKKFEIYHLYSYSESVGKVASEVASITRSQLEVKSGKAGGFTLNGRKFKNHYPKFTPVYNSTTSIRELHNHRQTLCVGKELTYRQRSTQPCNVCGSHDMVPVLDLGEQPLANSFVKTLDLVQPTYPLRLDRCLQCTHSQLSTFVDRPSLFGQYLYRSGTSATLKAYFGWLADKVGGEVSGRRVLEIACNDGSQLDEFKKRGWQTFGVDAADNLIKFAREGGHTVWTGLWGVDQPPKTMGGEFDAIVAQNVLAHVPDPVAFVRACKEVMSERSRLYLQTSQCHLYESGQIDTIYHEHISFFSPQSFQRLADQVGLTVVGWEIVPVHGGSCLVTMKRGGEAASLPAAEMLNQDWFYLLYRGRAKRLAEWMRVQTERFSTAGIPVVGYGAAAKGVVLIHYAHLSLKSIVDDSPLKQQTYCPNTPIPIIRTRDLFDDGLSHLIVVFAWNFIDEVTKRIQAVTNVTQYLMTPYPQQKIVRLTQGQQPTTIIQPYQTNDHWFQSGRKLVVDQSPVKILLVVHMRNEAFLLPYFIRHHLSMFDQAVFIDYASTDDTVSIFERVAPSGWRLVRSKNEMFDAPLVDLEVEEYEREYVGWWKVALTVTEFLVHHDLRSYLGQTTADALRFEAIEMIDCQRQEPLDPYRHLLHQRLVYIDSLSGHYSRIAHRFSDGGRTYDLGRHALVAGREWKWADEGFLVKWKWSPWPESKARKLQIRDRIPRYHFGMGWGTQHDVDEARLDRDQDTMCKTSRLVSFGDHRVDASDFSTKINYRYWQWFG